MSSKFFTNTAENTLFNKFKGITDGMGLNFQVFQAVSGFFRSSGYFKLRAELKTVSKIQILVGINIDDVFRKHDKAQMFFGDNEEAKKKYAEEFKEDIKNARYSEEVETGIIQLCDDLVSGRVEIKIHPSKNLHAKFYLCLPENHTENTDGWVIMGSSNISDSGLGTGRAAPRYELNVAMKDYDDVKFCKDEFARLWEEGVPLTQSDICETQAKTHLWQQPTPYELYMKVLIDTFGEQAEDEFSAELPDGFMDLKYQRDAVVQGYQMLCRHNGFFLADVVGLGKTIVAAMIVKRFIESNGKSTKVLVVYPPAVETNWKETFKKFRITNKTQFISNGSLYKILNETSNYHAKEEYDLIIVDESHNFRNGGCAKYDELQRICKAPRLNRGLITGQQKKVLLISATALNNTPSDLLNQILLFQDARRCSIENISNLQSYFAPYVARYKRIMAARKANPQADISGVDEIYSAIQRDVLEKITVRRTRTNIMNDPDYAQDLKNQKVVFPTVAPPNVLKYQMDTSLNRLFWATMEALEKQINYARYRAIEFLLPPYSDKYENPAHIAQLLMGVYKVHMVKRLESSFYAFKKSLKTFIRITNDMIEMFKTDKVLIIPELNVKDLQARGMEIDEIISYALEKLECQKDDIVYPSKAFKPEFLELLKDDLAALMELDRQWAKIDNDPKLDLFIEKMSETFLKRSINPTGKLVVFSESVDTVEYLTNALKERLGRTDVLDVCAKNRNAFKQIVRANFDANYSEKKDDYNIIFTSDVLAEGINLHRANVIINYDSPWNTSRLMQRIGRVNRIGSVAGAIHNYMFYPSTSGNQVIGLSQLSTLKMQGFHAALGEDVQIYSPEEMLHEFQLFDRGVKDSVDETLAFLREVRALYTADRKWYEKIKALPLKSRVLRAGKDDESVAFISSSRKTSYFLVKGDKAEPIEFLKAAKKLRAKPEEKALPLDANPAVRSRHFNDVNKALEQFESEIQQNVASETTVSLSYKNKKMSSALKFLRECDRWVAQGELDANLREPCEAISDSIKNGVYLQLEKSVSKLAAKVKNVVVPTGDLRTEIATEIMSLYETYIYASTAQGVPEQETDPVIVVSETFVSNR